MRRWHRNTLLVLLASLLAVEALYLLAANAALNSSRLTARISRNPEKFSIRWGAGWTLYPGNAHLRGVEMRGRSSRIEWYAKLGSVSASFRLLPLFDRIVDLRSVTASGIDYRQRRRSGPGGTAGTVESDLPPLPDLGHPAGRRAHSTVAEKRPGVPWTILADRIDAGIDQLWLGRYRLSGGLKVETSLKLVVRGPLEIPRVRASLARGDLAAGDRAILGGLHLEAEASLVPFVPKGVRALAVLGRTTGRFQVQADRATLAFLEAYFRKAPWLRFNGQAAMRADLRVEKGRLQPGSTFESHPEAVDIDFLDRKLTGRGRILLRVEKADGGPRSRAEVVLDEFALSVPGRSGPYAAGRGFKVTATSAALDLEDPFASLEVVADLPEAVVPDLSHFDRYVPPGSGLAIRGGRGTLAYHVEAAQGEKSIHGWMELSAEEMVMGFENYEIRGDVKVHTVLKEILPGEGRFDISGTQIDLKSHRFPWTATITFPKAAIRFSEPIQVDAVTTIRMTDTTPLVALFDARKDVSHFIEKLMTIRDVKGKTSLAVDDQGSRITDLELTGENFIALADLALHDGVKDGIPYLKLHVFSVGVEFDKGKKDLDLVRARKWFDRERAKLGRAPAGG